MEKVCYHKQSPFCNLGGLCLQKHECIKYIINLMTVNCHNHVKPLHRHLQCKKCTNSFDSDQSEQFEYIS